MTLRGRNFTEIEIPARDRLADRRSTPLYVISGFRSRSDELRADQQYICTEYYVWRSKEKANMSK